MPHTAHVREEALHLENVRQLFQVLRVIQYQEFIVFLSQPSVNSSHSYTSYKILKYTSKNSERTVL